METIYSNGKNIGVLSFVSHAFGTSSYNLPRALLLGKRARLELDVSFRSGVHLCLVLSCLALFIFFVMHTPLFPPRALLTYVFCFCSIFIKLDVDTAPIRLSYHGGSHNNSASESIASITRSSSPDGKGQYYILNIIYERGQGKNVHFPCSADHE